MSEQSPKKQATTADVHRRAGQLIYADDVTNHRTTVGDMRRQLIAEFGEALIAKALKELRNE